jgi:hypothetical protein
MIAMPRIHFVELHEQPWFPAMLRNEITDSLQYGSGALGFYSSISAMPQRALGVSRNNLSCLRTYRTWELRELTYGLVAPEYRWIIGEHSGAFRGLPITWGLLVRHQETRFKRGTNRLSKCTVQPVNVYKGHLHGWDSSVVFGYAQRLFIDRADRGECSISSMVVRAHDYRRMQPTADPSTAPLRNNEFIITNCLARADGPRNPECEFHRATGKA